MDDNLTEMKTIDSDDKRIYTLSKEAPVKAVVKLGVPLIAGMMIMVLYNLVDTYFIGLLRDDYQLAAVNLAYPVMMILVAISNMIGTGAFSLIARSLGAEDIRKVNNNLAVAYGELTVAAMGKPEYAFGITLVRQLFLYVPLLFVLDRCFGFYGMIWTQPVTEIIMMTVSLSLLYHNIKAEERKLLT